ncbi:MAG TPA: FAD-binding oxidoreductase [Woeseiaceae bacterium]|nr:FAD-binding oxidoreductase [Woeseiaceae bacterium]
MLIEQLKSIVGPKGWTSDPAAMAPSLVDWRGAFHGSAPIVLSPASTDEVAAVVSACAAAGVAIVPQGGNTSMCGGAVPDESGQQIVLRLGRMNRIRALDTENFSIEVEAGCILEHIQIAARKAGRLFALSLGAEGSCQIGGNLATNAGGINVIRYGTARAQTLGLEAVLADGTVINSLRSLRKDTAGYDLKQLFIGSEGTLGIITAATLKLFPDPGLKTTVLIAIESSGAAVRLLSHLRRSIGDSIEAFELISGYVFGLVDRHIPASVPPFATEFPWYVLANIACGDDTGSLEQALQQAVEANLAGDAILAKSAAESAALWRIRHSIAEAERAAGKALKHDVAVPVSRIEEFLQRGDRLLAELAPGAQLIAFGHVGDGNLHYNVAMEPGSEQAARVTEAIYALATGLGGSFSAEHGVGRLKREYLVQYRNESEIELMRTLKRAMDPLNILNPGKVI